MALQNTMIWLIGFPGVGKYTIAKEIAKQADFVLVDNHLVNNVVFSLIKPDGRSPLRKETWTYVDRVRQVVLDVIENLSPKEFNFVMTNVLTDDEQEAYEKIAGTFERRGAKFLPVLLTCSVEENERRIVMHDRISRMKDVNPETPRFVNSEWQLITIDHPHLLKLDVISMTPADAATTILQHAGSG